MLKGKIDRVEDVDGEAVIVEIKNRMKRLFNKVPDYEQIQVQTYMQIVNLQVNLRLFSFYLITVSRRYEVLLFSGMRIKTCIYDVSNL